MSYSKEQLEAMGCVEGRDFTEMPGEQFQQALVELSGEFIIRDPIDGEPLDGCERFGILPGNSIIDMQPVRWYLADRTPPPEQVALWVAVDDPAVDPENYSIEWAEFSRWGDEAPKWRTVGGDGEGLAGDVVLWAHPPVIPRGVIGPGT